MSGSAGEELEDQALGKISASPVPTRLILVNSDAVVPAG